MASAPSSPSTAGKCPICGKPTETEYRPFCSRRCADVDLGRWFNGGYAIAGRDGDEDEQRAEESSTEPGPDEKT